MRQEWYIKDRRGIVCDIALSENEALQKRDKLAAESCGGIYTIDYHPYARTKRCGYCGDFIADDEVVCQFCK